MFGIVIIRSFKRKPETQPKSTHSYKVITWFTYIYIENIFSFTVYGSVFTNKAKLGG